MACQHRRSHDKGSASTGTHLYRALDRGTPYLGDTSGKPQPKVGCAVHPRSDWVDQGNDPDSSN